MPFAAAVSEHPVPAMAIGETAGELLESLGPAPDLVALFVSTQNAGALEDAATAVGTILRPGALIGCAATGVIGDGRVIDGAAAVALWGGRMGAVEAVHLVVQTANRYSDLAPEDTTVLGWPARLPFDPAMVVLLADPFSFPVHEFMAWLAVRHPGLPVVGGHASAAAGPGGNRLAVDGAVVSRGAVAVLVGPGPVVQAVVSQGYRPVGQPYVVTRAERGVVYELGGQPAYERLLAMARTEVTDEERRWLGQAVFLGVVVDEYRDRYGPGDFVVRRVIGADQDAGAIAVDEPVAVGTTVQYQVRGPTTGSEDLRHLLVRTAADASSATAPGATGALMFAGHDRGRSLFPESDDDAVVVADALDRPAVGGFLSAGEFGPVGGRNFVHSSASSVVLLRDR